MFLAVLSAGEDSFTIPTRFAVCVRPDPGSRNPDPGRRGSLRAHLNGAQSLALVLCQLRVPDVHDEDEAVAVGVLPDLVLEGVIKDEDSALLPLPGTKETRMMSLYTD